MKEYTVEVIELIVLGLVALKEHRLLFAFPPLVQLFAPQCEARLAGIFRGTIH